MLWMRCLKTLWNKDDVVDDMPKESETKLLWMTCLKTVKQRCCGWHRHSVTMMLWMTCLKTVKQRWCCGWHRHSVTKMMLWMTCLKTQWNKDALLWMTSRQPTFDRQVLDEQGLGASDDATIDNSKQLQKQCTQLEKLHVWCCCF